MYIYCNRLQFVIKLMNSRLQLRYLCDVIKFCRLKDLSPKTISNSGGLHQMHGLHDYGLAAVARDSGLSFGTWLV